MKIILHFRHDQAPSKCEMKMYFIRKQLKMQ